MCPPEPEVHRSLIIKDPTPVGEVNPQEDLDDGGRDHAHLRVVGPGQAGPQGAWIEFFQAVSMKVSQL